LGEISVCCRQIPSALPLTGSAAALRNIFLQGGIAYAPYPELFTNQFFTVNTGRHQKLSFAAVFSYKQNNQQFICQRLKRVNNAGYTL
jgi:hypothetical protein